MFAEFEKYSLKKILIIRSSSKLFPVVVDELKKTFPDAELFALSNVDLPDPGTIADVYRTRTPGKFLFKDVKDFRSIVSRNPIDLAVVLYNSRRGYSYLNIDTFAFASGAKTILSVNIDKHISRVSFSRYCYKWIHRMFDCIWLIINLIMTSFVFVFITVIMTITLPFLMLKKQK
jgi:hypothetical protein